MLGQRLQERAQFRPLEPFDDTVHAVDRVDISGLPNVQPRAERPQQPVIFVERPDHGPGLGDRHQPVGPRAVRRDHPHQRVRYFLHIVGHLRGETAALGETTRETLDQPIMIQREM